MIKQGLELKQTQKLSPLQIQTIKLIELPIQELEQKIRAELEENPVLDDSPSSSGDEDSEKDISIDEIREDDSIPSYNLKVRNWGPDQRP
ncbi:MAG: RNA polymerase sigma-54 factor, partial [Bacteroidales bacterium]|nr:RNA polymerase sigma-54 factor [Bacteroidales bacterium]